jgi:hypothetical protein
MSCTELTEIIDRLVKKTMTERTERIERACLTAMGYGCGVRVTDDFMTGTYRVEITSAVPAGEIHYQRHPQTHVTADD